MIMYSFLLIPLDEGLCLGVIHHETLLDSLLIVISTATQLSTQDEALHQLILRHVEFNHSSHTVTTLTEHLFQGFCLRNSTGEAIEDHTFVLTSERIVDRGQDAYHQIVGNQLTIVNETFGCLA